MNKIYQDFIKIPLQSLSRYQSGFSTSPPSRWGVLVLFRGPISLVAPLQSGIAFRVMRGEIFIFFFILSLWTLMYIDDVFLNYIVPCMPFVNAEPLFRHDNVHPHMAQWMLKFLEEVEIAWFEWPTCSPDLNPIEHNWDWLGRRIWARIPMVNSLNALRTALQKHGCIKKKLKPVTL